MFEIKNDNQLEHFLLMKCIKDNTSNMDIQLEMEDWKWMWISKLKPTKWAWDTCIRKRTMKALGTHPSFPSQHKLDKWRAKVLSLSFSKSKPTGQPFSITLVTLVLSLSQLISIQYKKPTVFVLLSSLYCLPERDQPLLPFKF